MQQARKLYKADRIVSPVYPSVSPSARPDPGRRVKKFKLFVVFTLCFFLSLVVVAQYSSLVILNYRLSSARAELVAIQEASRSLELEVAQLSSIGRIDQIAREELNMVDPEIDQLRVITVSRTDASRLGE
ncbi:MAG: cell division protein FtsL [Dethiobacteria bacterium]|nr:cell division protein FtsL [Bacillota bacterium]MDW7728568.1 cell division protein FtsL [Bacillota bacterium]